MARPTSSLILIAGTCTGVVPITTGASAGIPLLLLLLLILLLLLLLVFPHTDPQRFIGTLATGQAVTRRGRHGLGKFHAALAALVTAPTNIDRPARTFRRHAVANEAEAHVACGGVGGQISAGGGY